jgi:hypothetical protein
MTSPEIGCESANIAVPHVNYKTKICKYGKNCHYGDRCFFAHSENEILPRTSRDVHSACRSTDGIHGPAGRSTSNREFLGRVASSFSHETTAAIDNIYQSSNKSDRKLQYLQVMPTVEQSVCGAFIQVLSDISSSSSCGACENDSGSTTPVSTDHPAESVGCLSYPIACIRYLQSIHSPLELEKLLREAAPLFYTE